MIRKENNRRNGIWAKAMNQLRVEDGKRDKENEKGEEVPEKWKLKKELKVNSNGCEATVTPPLPYLDAFIRFIEQLLYSFCSYFTPW